MKIEKNRVRNGTKIPNMDRIGTIETNRPVYSFLCHMWASNPYICYIRLDHLKYKMLSFFFSEKKQIKTKNVADIKTGARIFQREYVLYTRLRSMT